MRVSPCPSTTVIGEGLNWFHELTQFLQSGSQNLGPPFPFLLEVRIQQSPNLLIQANGTLRQLDTYQFLFSVLISGLVGEPPSKPLWAILDHTDRIENHPVRPGFVVDYAAQENDRDRGVLDRCGSRPHPAFQEAR